MDLMMFVWIGLDWIAWIFSSESWLHCLVELIYIWFSIFASVWIWIRLKREGEKHSRVQCVVHLTFSVSQKIIIITNHKQIDKLIENIVLPWFDRADLFACMLVDIKYHQFVGKIQYNAHSMVQFKILWNEWCTHMRARTHDFKQCYYIRFCLPSFVDRFLLIKWNRFCKRNGFD